VLIAGLSTGHEVGLAVVGGTFIAFALASSFLAPKRWPDFPGKQGLSVFVIACFVLFAGMITAVEVFGVEKSEASAGSAEAASTIEVTESEYTIALPSEGKLAPGTYTFVVKNDGKIGHNLIVQGSDPAGAQGTALIAPGATAKLVVKLAAGTYTLYCSVDSHRQQGMLAKLSVA
jgi:uncharacterized cupredoxin-like copper-binding protein